MNGTATPTTDRQLLARISQWRKACGWTFTWRGWIAPDRSFAVDVQDGGDGLGTGFRIMRGDLLNKPTDYPADSIREAVDLLVALDILPGRFARAYEAGWHDGYFFTAEDETAAEIKASWTDSPAVAS